MTNNMKVSLSILYSLFAILPSPTVWGLVECLPTMLFITKPPDLRLYPSGFSAFMKSMAYKWIYLKEMAQPHSPSSNSVNAYWVRTRNIWLSVQWCEAKMAHTIFWQEHLDNLSFPLPRTLLLWTPDGYLWGFFPPKHHSWSAHS